MAEVRIMRVDDHYAYSNCGQPITRKFINSGFANTFAERYGGTVQGDTVIKPCGNTVKFNTELHSVCPACGSVWQIDGEIARRWMKTYTYNEIATDFNLWGEYVDPDGLTDKAAFDAYSLEEKLRIMEECFGPESPDGDE